MGISSIRKRIKRILALALAFAMLISNFSDFRLVVKADATLTQNSDGGEQPDGENGNGGQTQTTLTVMFDGDVAETKEYTGEAINLPGLVVTDGTEQLESTEYEVKWTNEKGETVDNTVTNAGTYTCTITANEDPSKVGKITFEVTQKSIEGVTVSGIENVTFNGSIISGLDGLTIELDGTDLSKNSDYTVTYANSEGTQINSISKEGIYTLAITGTGNYTGTSEQELKVTRNINTMPLSIDSVTYNGQAVTISDLKVNGLNCDYNVASEEEVKNAGEYVLTVTANDDKGIYTGSKTVNFTINKLDLALCTVNVEPSAIPYTGDKVEEPNVEVRYDGNEISNENYNVAYSPDTLKEKGDYSVIVTAKDNGNLTGSKTADFCIVYSGLFEAEDAISGTIEPTDMSGLNMVYNSTEKEYFYKLDNDAEEKKVTIKPQESYEFVSILPSENDKIEAVIDGDKNLVITFSSQDTAVVAEQDIAITLLVKSVDDESYNEISIILAEASFIAFETNSEVSISYETQYTITENESTINWANKITKIDFPEVSESGAGNITYYYSTDANREDKTNSIPASASLDYSIFNSETTYYYWAEDALGNQTQVIEFTICKLDITAPTITVKKNAEDADDIANGTIVFWNASDEIVDDENGGKQIEILVEASDSESNLTSNYLEGIQNSFNVTEGEVSSTEISQSVSDNVGNSAQHTFMAVYDPIPPTVEVELSTDGIKTEDSTNINMLSSDDVTITFKITGEAKCNDIVLLDRVEIRDNKDGLIKTFGVEGLTYCEEDGTEPYYKGTYRVTTEEWLKETYTITAFDKAGNAGENSSVDVTIEIDKIAPEITNNSISIKPEVTGKDDWTKEDTVFVVTVPNTAKDRESSAKVYLEYKKESDSIWSKVSDYVPNENGNLIFETPLEIDDFYRGCYLFRVSDELENIVDDDNNGEADAVRYCLKKDKVAPESAAYIQFISDIKGANENVWTQKDDSWYSKISEMASSLWNKIWGRTTLSFEVYVRDEHSGVDFVKVSYGNINSFLEKPVDGIEVVALEGNTDGGYQKKTPVEDGDNSYTVFTGRITIANSDIEDISYNDFAISEIKDKAGNTTTDISLKNADDNTVIYLDSVKPKLTGVEIASDKLVRETYYYNKEVSVALTIEERFFKDAPEPTVEIYEKTSKETDFTNGEPVENLDWELVADTTNQYTTNIPLKCVSEEEIEYQIRVTYKDGSDNELVSEDYSVIEGVYTSPTIVLDGKAPKLTVYEITGNSDREVNSISVYKNNVESDDVTVKFTLDDNAEYWNGYENQLLITVKDSISGVELVKMDGTDSDITWSDNDRAHTGTFTFDGKSTEASNYQVTISYTDRAGNAMVIDNAAITEGNHEGNTYTGKEFILDHVAPVFNISYNTPYLFRTAGDTALSSDDKSGTEIDMKNVSGYTAHYKEDIEVSFTMDEQYAVPMMENTTMTGLNDCIVTVIKDGVEMETLPEITWTKSETESVYEGKFTLTEDGTYEIIVKYQDTAANVMEAGDEVNGVASMDDGTYRSIKLVLDKTVPVVSVAYVDQTTQTEAVPTETEGRIYFTNPVNMRITVTDSYIRTEELRTVILDKLEVKDADGKDITENTVSAFLNGLASSDAKVKANEVVWDIPLTTEANYTFDFVYTNLVGLAGNHVLEKVTVDKTIPEADDAWIAFTSDVNGSNEAGILDKLHQFWNKIWGRTEIDFTVYVRDEIADIASMEVSYVLDNTEDNVIEYSTIDTNKKSLTIQNDKYPVENEAENVTVKYVMITGTLKLSDITDASDLLLNQFTITSLKDKAGNDACEENVITFSKNGYSGNIYLDNQNPKLMNVYVDETFIKEAELPYHYNKEVEVVLEVDERFLHDAENFPEVTLRCEKTSTLAAGEVKTWEEVVENLNWDNKVSNTVSTYYTTVTLPVVENSEIEYQIKMTYQDGAENLLISSDSSAYSVENGVYTSEIIVIDDVAPELTAYEIIGNSDREVNGISVYKNVEDEDVTVTFILDDNAEYWNGYQNQLLITVKDSISGVELVKMDGTNSDITWLGNDRAHTGTFTFDGESEAASNYLVTISYTDRAGNAMVIDNAAITEGSYAGNTYTSKEFILDHVAPVFNISYNTPYRNVKEGNAAANDVLGAEDANLQPQTGYTSYYQDEIVATFTIDEQYANFENGLADSTITVYKDGEEISLENNPTVKLTWEAQETTYTGTLTIKADEANNVSADGSYQIQINYVDTAKNNMTAGEKVDGSESATPVTNGTYKSTMLVLDTTSPEIEVTYVDETTKEKVTPVEQRGERIYFAKPVNMRITVEDVNLRDHELKKYLSENFKVTDINGKSILSSDAEKEINTPECLSKDGTTITWEIPLSTDANYEFPISYEDLAGNTKPYTTQKVTKDQSPPNLKLEYSVANSGFWDAINYKDLGFLFADHKLTIQANATDNITGVYRIKFTILDEHGNETEKLSTIEEPTYTSSFEVAIPWETNDFNGVVKVEVLDLLENTREESHGYIVESTEKHSTTGSAKITTKTAPSRIVEGVKYYNTSVDLNITLEDNYSGLRSYEYKAGKDKEMEGSYSYAEKAGDDLSAEKEHSITRLYSKDLTLDGKVNNENDVLVTAKLVDNAGHVTSVEQKYNIDTTVPEITVEYNLNEPSFEKFYNQTRIATVKIKERNFSEKDVDFTITNTHGEAPSIGNWSKSGSGDDTVHTCQVVFSADGDYTFTLAFQDLAGNKAKYDRTDEFTIDQTKPVYTVSYDNNNSLNDYYYAQTRTATIDILEHNFDASLINVVMTANAGGVVPSVSSWSRDGDHNIATVTFSTDGDYTFTISGKDQAENEMDAYAQERFIIDLTAPEVEIFDIEPNSANNGIVMPGIRYSDTNYDINGSSVHMVGYHNGEVEMKGTTSRTDTGVEVKLNDFEHVQAMDDLYTMNAVVSDLAGNTTEASVTFSVNRYGSVYTFDEITDKLVGDEGNFYTNEEQDIVVIETNVDTLEFKEITCNLNGTLSTLIEGEDYTVSESGTDASWKQYTYTISKENFVEEGNYLLTIYSEDRALNTSDSNTKNKRIEFVVDKTMPSVLISGVENDGQYRENSRPVTLDIEDNVMLSEVKVILNGEEIVYPASEISATDGRLEFVIDSYNDWQTLQVIAIDKAGNENASEEMRFLVTANVFVQFFRNKTLVWGTAGGMTVAAGGIYWLLLARRKRKVSFKK